MRVILNYNMSRAQAHMRQSKTLPDRPFSDSAPPAGLRGACAVSELPIAQEARVVGLVSAQGDHSDTIERLAELGFVPGERVRLLARALFGDPIAVRVSSGTFALRLAEAACIRVELVSVSA
jgi:ferrous iron transport protein A